MKKIAIALLCALIVFPAVLLSQDAKPSVNIRMNTRFDYTLQAPSEESLPTLSSFDGKFLNLMIDGNINDRFSYSFRHRLFRDGLPDYQSFFRATDWLYLNYQINKNWYLSGGKQIVAIGGFEYDAAPIDQYFWSEFWNNVGCYQLGATAGYTTDNKNHTVAFQVANSPFTTHSLQGIYSYNLIWYGNFRNFNTIYSLNRIEYEKGKFINYIALGNKIDLGPVSCEIDFMNRYADAQNASFLSDFTLIGKANFRINPKLSMFVKGGYDENSAQSSDDEEIYDRFVLPGIQHAFVGAGAEYFPITDKKDVRLHGFIAYNEKAPDYLTFNVGVTWQFNLLNR